MIISERTEAAGEISTVYIVEKLGTMIGTVSTKTVCATSARTVVTWLKCARNQVEVQGRGKL